MPSLRLYKSCVSAREVEDPDFIPQRSRSCQTTSLSLSHRQAVLEHLAPSSSLTLSLKVQEDTETPSGQLAFHHRDAEEPALLFHALTCHS